MKIRSIAIFLLFALPLLFFLIARGKVESLFVLYESQANCSASLADFDVLGWVPYWDQENAFKSFEKHAKYFDYVAFFWYKLDEKGEIAKYVNADEDLEMVKRVQARGAKALALFVNLPDDYERADWDPKRVEKAISTEEARKRHINKIVSLVETKGFDGVNVGYEMMRGDQKENFSLFISQLADELHKKNKILGVSILPKTSESNPNEDNGSHAQDLKIIGEKADQLYFELYGEHYPQGQPGPVASARWIEKILDYAINEVEIPKNKIFAGVPFYAEAWEISKSGRSHGLEDELNIKDAEKIRKENESLEKWDEWEKSAYFFYQKNGKSYIVWTEDNASICKKLEIFKKYGLKNISLWRLGGEDEDFWKVFAEN